VQHLFLLGDIFDFWFEYKDVIPRGHYAFFAKLQQLSQQGVQIYYFTGNHDMWVKKWLAEEIGMTIYRKEQLFHINGRLFLIGHGDGLDPKDKGYLLIKRIFAFRPNIALYGSLPPRWAFAFARYCSHSSRVSNMENVEMKEQLSNSMIAFAKKYAAQNEVDYIVFGHLHCPQKNQITDRTIYYNTGDWLHHNSFLRCTPDHVELCTWSSDEGSTPIV